MKVLIDSFAWISKSELTSDQLANLRQTLTIIPRKVGDHPGESPSPIQLFSETSVSFGMPRQFFMRRRKPAHDVEFRVSEGDFSTWPGPLVLAPGFTLREEQARAKLEVAGILKGGGLGGIIQAPCGFGKTVLACALLESLQCPTLVVVHKDFLMTQWKERLEAFLPGIKIGIAQGPELDYKGKHVVIGMMQSLSMKDYPEEFRKWPKLTITDEVHRVAAGTWAVVPTMFPSRWRCGLSATPRRLDGAEDVFRFHIGDIIFTSKEQRLKPKIKRVWTDFQLLQTNKFNPGLVKKTLLLKFLCTNTKRNATVIEQVIAAAKAGRKCLVVSERLQHLRDMETMLYGMWKDTDGAQPSIGYYIGNSAREELEEAAKCQVIFATNQLCSEGLDIPAIDTLFLTVPLGNVEQVVGRILRPCDGKKDPVVVDFRDDNIALCKRYASYRDKLYVRLT